MSSAEGSGSASQPGGSASGSGASGSQQPSAAWVQAANGHFGSGNYFQAQVAALKGILAADAAHDDCDGAALRQVLAGSIAMAGEAATPGRLRVGKLRRVIGEAALLAHRCRSSVPEGEVSPAAAAGAVALRFFDSRGMDQERVDALPNDAVEPCFSGVQRQAFLASPGGAVIRRCGGCGGEIESNPKVCVRCRVVAYCNKECQQNHWRAGASGHRRRCQPVELGSLDWAAEAAAAEAGLVAWEQAGREEGSATAEERLELAQTCAVWDQGEGEPEGQAEPMAGPAAFSRERQQQRGRGGAERGDGAARGQGQRGPPVDDLRQMMMSVLTTGAAPVTEAQTAAWMALPKDRPVKPEDMGPDCVIM